ncbi:MAG: hypothetical protein FK733_14840 [Asgard group archaeon]|nr:hypothetical protein [Asgard group archaeon]
MTEKYFKCYNGDAIVKTNPAELILKQIKTTDSVLRFLSEINTGLVEKYTNALIKRLENEVGKYSTDTGSLSFKSIESEISNLKQNDKLTNLVIRYITKSLKLPENTEIASEAIEITNYNRAFASERISYYRVKAFTEILGKEKGIELYTKILGKIITEMYSKTKPNEKITIKPHNEGAVKYWSKIGLGDFTFRFIDDNQCIYRFDKCITHEVLKELNDPDVAYIASCFFGDIPEFNSGRIIHMRRTQTLHHADFCDELYWDSREFKEPPEQPSLEFTRKIGKNKK